MCKDASSWADELADEHAHLGVLLRRVVVILDNPPQQEIRRILLPLLEELSTGVREHMDFEERGGYLAPVQQRMPNLFGTIEQLRGEHAQLQSGLAEIETVVRAEPGVEEFKRTVAPRLRQWLSDIRDHERRENLLVQEALNTDLGAGD